MTPPQLDGHPGLPAGGRPALTVIVPSYNEGATIAEVLRRVLATGLRLEILVVDDGSTDDTAATVRRLAAAHPEIRLLSLPENRGKGAAVRRGIAEARGEYLVIQDADLEYDPQDLVRLLAVAREGADIVYGSRIRGHNPASYSSFYWGGRLLSLITSALYGCWITDEPTCYKLFRAEVLADLPLQEDGFGFCPEVTAKVLRRGHRIAEVPISYRPRSMEQGKKIRWTDGLRAIWILARLRLPPR